MSTPIAPHSRTLRSELFRFGRLTLAMGIGVGCLFLCEVAVMRWIGGSYLAPPSHRQIRVDDFSLTADGRWAASSSGSLRYDLHAPWEWQVLLHDLRQPQSVFKLKVGLPTPRDVAISPDGSCVAFTTADGILFATGIDGSDRVPRLVGRLHRNPLERPCWSPDGRYLAAAAQKDLYLWEMPTGRPCGRFSHGSQITPPYCFSPDSRWILAGDDHGRLRQWDLVDRKQKMTVICNDDAIMNIDVSADGRFAAFVTERGATGMHRIADGRNLWQTAVFSRRHPRVALSPDGASLATVEHEIGSTTAHRICIRCAKTGRRRFTLEGHQTYLLGMRFACDGTLYSWDVGGLVLGWDLQTQQPRWWFSCSQSLPELALIPAGRDGGGLAACAAHRHWAV